MLIECTHHRVARAASFERYCGWLGLSEWHVSLSVGAGPVATHIGACVDPSARIRVVSDAPQASKVVTRHYREREKERRKKYVSGCVGEEGGVIVIFGLGAPRPSQ